MSNSMSFNDRVRQTLVYFGLAEQEVDHYDRYADEADYAPEPQRTPRRSSAPRRRPDEYEEIFADEGASPRESTVLRAMPDQMAGGGFGDVRVHLVLPKSFNDAQQMADRYKDGTPVILNLQGVESDLSRRLIDFGSGLTYALDGGMQRIADKVFMLTPRNVELSAEQRAQLLEKGFFNQS
jgi:cell division inhibitor SepF